MIPHVLAGDEGGCIVTQEAQRAEAEAREPVIGYLYYTAGGDSERLLDAYAEAVRRTERLKAEASLERMWYAGQAAIGAPGHKFIEGTFKNAYGHEIPNRWTCALCPMHRNEHRDLRDEWAAAALAAYRDGVRGWGLSND